MKLTALKPRLATLITQRIPTQAGTERLRGSQAVKRRAKWLELHPLCEVCARRGEVTAGSVVDHRVPLWAGGADDYEANGGTLCDPDHDAKSDCEAQMRAAGGWLSTPCRCGQHEQASA